LKTYWAYLEAPVLPFEPELQFKKDIFSVVSSANSGPYTAVSELIQGVFLRYPKYAQKILRSRIYTNEPPSHIQKGILKGAAKRFSFEKDRDYHPSIDSVQVSYIDKTDNVIGWKLESLNFNVPIEKPNWLATAHSLFDSKMSSGVLYKNPRNISALLFSSDFKLLGAAVNTNQTNKTLHAEVNLVQGYFKMFQKKFPQKSIVFSTLKPCRMCTGFLYDWAEDPNLLEIFYETDDPGPFAKNSFLPLNKFEL
jgi:cytidine deaminase